MEEEEHASSGLVTDAARLVSVRSTRQKNFGAARSFWSHKDPALVMSVATFGAGIFDQIKTKFFCKPGYSFVVVAHDQSYVADGLLHRN